MTNLGNNTNLVLVVEVRWSWPIKIIGMGTMKSPRGVASRFVPAYFEAAGEQDAGWSENRQWGPGGPGTAASATRTCFSQDTLYLDTKKKALAREFANA